MKITLVAAQSLDGKITKHDNPHVRDWTSDEDFAHFSQLKDQYEVLIMGRGTYEAVRPEPQAERLRLVLTHHPELFGAHAQKGMLEFMNAEPAAVVAELERRGYKNALLVGGGKVHSEFLDGGLVDDLYLTFEPALFGTGISLVEKACDVRLHLVEMKQLNKQGTLLGHYKVVKQEL